MTSDVISALVEPGPEPWTLRSVISTALPDRAGDVIIPAGLANRAEFLRNPVVLWAHRRDLPPIGFCTKLEVLADRVVATTRFCEESAFSAEVYRLCRLGVIRGWSIGFRPLADAPRPGTRGRRVSRWELLEYSAVPVPENPEALTVGY